VTGGDEPRHELHFNEETNVMTIERRMPLNHVLVATDFSPGAALALERAVTLPLSPGATVSLLHVVSEVVPRRLLDPVLEHARGLLQTSASDAQRAAAEHGSADVKIEQDVVVGTPFVEIIRYARSRGADLVVAGRHGPRAVRDAFVGSTAERVVRKGDVSVLLVKEGTIAPYERALVAIDLSDASSRVVELALTLLPPSKRTLRMVHAYHVAFEGLLFGDALEQYRRELGEHASATATSIAAPYDASGIECRVIVREGDPRTVILREALRERCDLIVLGTHARSGVSHALLGSVAEWLVRAAPCDVAVTRPTRFTFELP
jgi:nucleotide-binding universal stress UspA family protein